MRIHDKFATAYTKAVILNPKSVVSENIHRAFESCPEYEAAFTDLARLKEINAALLGVLKEVDNELSKIKTAFGLGIDPDVAKKINVAIKLAESR